MISAAYNLGRQAYTEGKTLKDNPYGSGVDALRPFCTAREFREWQQGWFDAVEADPLLDEDEKQLLLTGDDDDE